MLRKPCSVTCQERLAATHKNKFTFFEHSLSPCSKDTKPHTPSGTSTKTNDQVSAGLVFHSASTIGQVKAIVMVYDCLNLDYDDLQGGITKSHISTNPTRIVTPQGSSWVMYRCEKKLDYSASVSLPVCVNVCLLACVRACMHVCV